MGFCNFQGNVMLQRLALDVGCLNSIISKIIGIDWYRLILLHFFKICMKET